jgi:hypothetical protein
MHLYTLRDVVKGCQTQESQEEDQHHHLLAPHACFLGPQIIRYVNRTREARCIVVF